MKILISGICGFVGSTLAQTLHERHPDLEILGFDNFIRPGSELNRLELKRHGISVIHADVRSATDIEALPSADWVIDAAANPSVLAGVDGKVSSRQLLEHNLSGTVNLLEFCKANHSGFILLSTSRVYSIPGLSALAVTAQPHGAFPGTGFVPDPDQAFPEGLGNEGVSERYSTASPVSLYGSTKLASELLALEYGKTFDFPVWINRCGVLAGAGQFGRADQGIFAFWINSWLRKSPLRYIGFGGSGYQVRDCLHPRDLATLVTLQFDAGARSANPQIVNVSGGVSNSMSLNQLSAWCAERFGPGPESLDSPASPDAQDRPFDIPWIVLDPTLAKDTWGWTPCTPIVAVLDEIAEHAAQNPDWLDLSAP